jgi:hypothetical protein
VAQRLDVGVLTAADDLARHKFERTLWRVAVLGLQRRSTPCPLRFCA